MGQYNAIEFFSVSQGEVSMFFPKFRKQMLMNEVTMILDEQIAVLKDIAQEYSGKTIENIIVQLEARRDEMSKE